MNLGCRRRVVSGLDWAFEQVDEAIILEDDILPDLSFFPFCEEMLERFRGDDRISMITGFNITADRAQAPYSYYFSRLTHIWGWATWRDAWKHYDERLSSWPEIKRSELLREFFSGRTAVRYWTGIWEGMFQGNGPNTWDYQWMYTNLMRGALSVTPQKNLVQNLGFGADATHSKNSRNAPKVCVSPLQFPLQHPPAMIAARSLDELDEKISGWHTPALPIRGVRKTGRILFG